MKKYIIPVNRRYLETLSQPLSNEFVIRVNYASGCPLRREYFLVNAEYVEYALTFFTSLTLVRSVDVQSVFDVDFF